MRTFNSLFRFPHALLWSLIGCMTLFSCSDDENNNQEPEPEAPVTRFHPYINEQKFERTSTEITVYAQVSDWDDKEDLSLYTYGICYSTQGTPDAENESTVIVEGSKGEIHTGTGLEFSVKLSGLQPYTAYHCRSYLEKDGVYAYSEEKTALTLPGDDGNDVPTQGEAIDLGLSVLWASHNVGATAPEEAGGLYGWGDATGNHKEQPQYDFQGAYMEDEVTCFGYYGGRNPEKDICGDVRYDIARKQWGEPWKLPTADQLDELRITCLWKLITYNNVKGYLIIGPSGNKIFLPAAGIRQGNTPVNTGENGDYWSGTLGKESSVIAEDEVAMPFARMLGWDHENAPLPTKDSNIYRWVGMSVRPVQAIAAE